jgi:hypothetical protein
VERRKRDKKDDNTKTKPKLTAQAFMDELESSELSEVVDMQDTRTQFQKQRDANNQKREQMGRKSKELKDKKQKEEMERSFMIERGKSKSKQN